MKTHDWKHCPKCGRTHLGPHICENKQTPRVILTHPGKSSYSDGLVWVPIGGLEKGAGIWLKPGESLAVLPALSNDEGVPHRPAN